MRGKEISVVELTICKTCSNIHVDVLDDDEKVFGSMDLDIDEAEELISDLRTAVNDAKSMAAGGNETMQ